MGFAAVLVMVVVISVVTVVVGVAGVIVTVGVFVTVRVQLKVCVVVDDVVLGLRTWVVAYEVTQLTLVVVEQAGRAALPHTSGENKKAMVRIFILKCRVDDFSDRRSGTKSLNNLDTTAQLWRSASSPLCIKGIMFFASAPAPITHPGMSSPTAKGWSDHAACLVAG